MSMCVSQKGKNPPLEPIPIIKRVGFFTVWGGVVFPFWVRGFSLLGGKTCLGGGFSLLGPNKLTLGPVDLFGLRKRQFLSKWDFGEIDFTNDRLKLKINVNPTSWDYSMPF